MTFFKYPELANLNAKQEQNILEWHDSYLITEKLDGCNVCMVYNYHKKTWHCYSRKGLNAVAVFGEDFNKAFEKIRPELDKLVELKGETFKDVIGETNRIYMCPKYIEFYIVLYGELVNSKTLRRIRYFDGTPQIRLFDYHIYGKKSYMGSCLNDWNFKEKGIWRLIKDLKEAGVDYENLLVPIYNEKNEKGDYKLLSYTELHSLPTLPTIAPNTNFESKEGMSIGNPKGLIEGFVFHAIEKWDGTNHINGTFKFKSEHFVSKTKSKAPKVKQEFGKENELFKNYLNVNRAYEVQSKIGQFTHDNLKEAITELIKDARKDFLKDHEEFVECSKEELKRIFHAGKLPYEVIAQVIQENESERS